MPGKQYTLFCLTRITDVTDHMTISLILWQRTQCRVPKGYETSTIAMRFSKFIHQKLCNFQLPLVIAFLSMLSYANCGINFPQLHT